MCFADVQGKLNDQEYESFDAFALDVHQVLKDADSYCDLSAHLHWTLSRLAGRFDVMIAALPHCLTQVEKQSPFQRLVELRFARYRTMKGPLAT
jgi:hypothetical protein